jgi:hypothetical protein
MVYFSYPESMHDKLVLTHGTVVVNEEIRGDVDLTIESSKCSLDMKTCTKHPTLKIRDLCKVISDKNAFYSNALEQITPRLKCPLKPGNYTISKCSADMSILSLLAIDGYVWVVEETITSDDGKTKKKVLCNNSVTKISKFQV